jgi:hypothetical protein
MIKSGADICNEITSYEAIHEPSLNTKEYSDLVGEGYYLFSDVDLRIKFYTQYAGNPGQLLKDYVGLEDVYLKKHQMYSDWLFVFCFGDMTENFQEKIGGFL